ncbi:uncharacterized protein LOC129588169 [Paramacrobiotus metropolitanus]|uniref:uncharacterized protein LOC129588169 n=1 Tax=Paramacrobiotus metropolitanus TaxID=2943436 RepID=UPI0024465C8A|nr:uncharacterized protein LOC129588169 [Paramacrobiotus metropolitanus]
MYFTFSLFIVALGIIAAHVDCLQLQSCDDHPRVRLHQVDLNPSDIHSNQELGIDAIWNVVQEIDKPLKAEVKLFKKIGFIKAQLPCKNNIGSCTYDLCADGSVPICNTKRGMHRSNGYKLKVPNFPPEALGSYDVEIRIVDGKNRNFGCWKTSANVVR